MDSHLAEIMKRMRDVFAEKRDELNLLDSAIGDGDHGTGMAEGFAEAWRRVAEADPDQPAEILRVTAMALMNHMGGASGAIFGTLFLRTAGELQGAEQLNAPTWGKALQAGLDAVMQRGKARPGDKTMVDALFPAVQALNEAAGAGHDLADAFQQAALAAEEGARRTADFVAQHGRARYAGDRAIGHVDAGAVSIASIFRALADYYGKVTVNDET